MGGIIASLPGLCHDDFIMQDPTRFLRACRGEPVDRTPVWFMRQAGRYLPAYQATRARAGDFLTLCRTPELACEVTLQPVDLLGVDAAILFSDILVPLEAMGLGLSFTDEGPRVQPVRDEAGIAALRVPAAEELPYVLEAVRLIRRELAGRVPLIGFAGAPFTLLTYAVEGQTGRQFAESKRLLFTAPQAAHALLDKLARTVTAFLRGQAAAGAQALMLFDSWAGVLSRADYAVYAAPYVQRVLTELKPLGVPLIYFANDGTALLPEVGKLPADVFSVDWRLPLSEAAARLGSPRPLQGNLDPCALFAPLPEIARRVQAILEDARGLPGHIFNLGHGILPQTPWEHVQAVVELVHGEKGHGDGKKWP
jgi:uroporphyrinogen decarboxylase